MKCIQTPSQVLDYVGFRILIGIYIFASEWLPFQTANVMLQNVNKRVKKFAVCAWMQIAVICKIKTNISEIRKAFPPFFNWIFATVYVLQYSSFWNRKAKSYGIKTTSYAHKTTSYAHKTTSYARKTTSYAHKTTSYAHKTTSYAFKTYEFDSWN